MEKQKSIKGLLIYLLVGIIALILSILHGLSTNPDIFEQMSEMTGLSVPPVVLGLLAVMPNFVLFLIFLLIGFFIAHKVGLKSVIIHPHAREKPKSEWKKGIKLAIILGLISAVALRGFDYLFRLFLPDSLIELLRPYSALEFITALLYGGILEELLMRFGLMSLLVFIFWKLFERKSAKPSNWVFIVAIFISALLFALGHYGITASNIEMTPFIWFRMILLNGLPGLFFGWIYWKHNLELAMLAHIFTHVGMNLLMWIFFFLM